MSFVEKFEQTFIVEARYMYFLDGLKMTLILTLGSFVLGTLIAALMCLARKSKHKVISNTFDAINKLFVQLPTMVLMMIFVYVIFGVSSLSIIIVVIFALTIKAAAYLSDIFSSSIATVNPGEIEAARTLGMTKFQAFKNVILPQAIHTATPIYKNQFISTMQETSVVGYLAIMDLTKASNIVTARTLDAMFGLITISVIYLLLGYIGTFLIGLIDKKSHLGGGCND